MNNTQNQNKTHSLMDCKRCTGHWEYWVRTCYSPPWVLVDFGEKHSGGIS